MLLALGVHYQFAALPEELVRELMRSIGEIHLPSGFVQSYVVDVGLSADS